MADVCGLLAGVSGWSAAPGWPLLRPLAVVETGPSAAPSQAGLAARGRLPLPVPLRLGQQQFYTLKYSFWCFRENFAKLLVSRSRFPEVSRNTKLKLELNFREIRRKFRKT